MIDKIIVEEFTLYLKRYQAWYNSNETDDVARTLIQESERILRQLYRVKYNPKDDKEEMIGYMNFMSDLGSKIKLL